MNLRAILHVVASPLLALLIPLHGHAQTATGATAVSGSILDAASNEPLAYATVTLEPAPAGALPGRGAAVPQARVILSDSAGRYRFVNVTAGDYRIHVQRTGYRSRSLDVRVRPESDTHISVGLQMEPVTLEPVAVEATGLSGNAQPYARRARDPDDVLIADALRLAAERARQRTYLSTDVRVVTHADVVEGISLGETDLFRALQRLPGITAVDDWSAELITRGAPWDQTRVYFDGLPLFNSLHASGMFAGVNTDAVGAAFLHPGTQPAVLGGAAAASLDIRSRSGSGDLAGVGELSLASARFALDHRTDDGRKAWMIAARRSYVDVATRALEPLVGEDGHIPYMFMDVAARGDIHLGNSSVLEMSALLMRDNAYGEITDVLEATRARWGGPAARITLAAPVLGMHTRHTLGFSGYSSTVEDVPFDDPFRQPRAGAARNRLQYFVARGELQHAARPEWSGGYEVARYQMNYAGRHPQSSDLVELLDSLRFAGQLNVGAAWLQRRITLGDAFSGEVGVRAEAGAHTMQRGSIAAAPRLSMRATLGALNLSAAYGRTWQYMQALTPAGAVPVGGFATDFLWLLAGDTIPALRSDVVTAGVERWIREQWLVAINGYARSAIGVTTPDPRAGELVDRPLYVSARNDAHGVEVSVRRLTGRWTGSAGYTLGWSTLRHEDMTFPAPMDRRHTFDATIAGRVGRSWRVGAAYTGASGAPYTQRYEAVASCDTVCHEDAPARQGEPNAARRKPHHSLDLNLEWMRRMRGWQLETFLQVRNVLHSDNQGRYVRTETPCYAQCGTPQAVVVERENFLPALPIVPLIGARVSF